MQETPVGNRDRGFNLTAIFMELLSCDNHHIGHMVLIQMNGL